MSRAKHKKNYKHGKTTYNHKQTHRPQRVRKRKISDPDVKERGKHGKSSYPPNIISPNPKNKGSRGRVNKKISNSKSSKKNKKLRATGSCSSHPNMRRNHSHSTHRHTNPMMDAYPDTKKTSWYRFQRRSRNKRGRDYLSRGKLGHHSGRGVTSISIHKNDRFSVKRQSSVSNLIDFETECDEFGSRSKRPIPSRTINKRKPIRRGYTTEKEKTRCVILERNSNGPRTTRKGDTREETSSSGARTYVVRRSKETSITSSHKKKRRRKLHYTETPSRRLLQVKIKVVDEEIRVNK